MSLGDFALVSEGVTDQLILKQLLLGFFQTYTDATGEDPIINFEQPPLDETSRHGAAPPAGWSLVFKYFESGRFKQALQTNRYLIVQIDTDVCADYGISRHENGADLSPDELIDRVIAKFRSLRTRQDQPRLSDPQGNKYPEVYKRVVKPYAKNKELMRNQDRNPSLQRFLQELTLRHIGLSPPES